MTPSHFEHLTPRQMQIAALYADTDLSARQIGALLGIAERSVTKTAGRVYQKLRVHSRPQLRYAMLSCELAPVGAR